MIMPQQCLPEAECAQTDRQRIRKVMFAHQFTLPLLLLYEQMCQLFAIDEEGRDKQTDSEKLIGKAGQLVMGCCW